MWGKKRNNQLFQMRLLIIDYKALYNRPWHDVG